ncbi:hypothetical protein [Muninn virus]|nr:hypothetical protein [Muninn virus]
MVKKILSPKIIELSEEEFKTKYLEGKNPETVKRYLRYYRMLKGLRDEILTGQIEIEAKKEIKAVRLHDALVATDSYNIRHYPVYIEVPVRTTNMKTAVNSAIQLFEDKGLGTIIDYSFAELYYY